jgi:hypothetical protein
VHVVAERAERLDVPVLQQVHRPRHHGQWRDLAEAGRRRGRQAGGQRDRVALSACWWVRRKPGAPGAGVPKANRIPVPAAAAAASAANSS